MVSGQPQNEASSAAKSSLLNKVKAMDSTVPQPKADSNQKTDNAVDPNAMAPSKPQSKDSNGKSDSFNQGAAYGSDESSGSDSAQVIEAGLIPSASAWGVLTSEKLMGVTGASLLVGGALCLRRAGRLGSHLS
jgi:hypothetical protein